MICFRGIKTVSKKNSSRMTLSKKKHVIDVFYAIVFFLGSLFPVNVFADIAGGTVYFTQVSDAVYDKIHVFTASGSLVVPSGVSITADLLVVGGGGGGGNSGCCAAGGGGGAGEVLVTTIALSAGTYSIDIGAGGLAAPTTSAQGGNGGSTSISGNGQTINSLGGGGGGSYASGSRDGLDGASGGGGAAQIYQGNAGLGTLGKGYNGASGLYSASSKTQQAAGGGGGAGAAAPTSMDSTYVRGLSGGIGISNDISGISVFYGGGGGGGRREGGGVNTLPGLGGSNVGGNGGGGSEGIIATAPASNSGSGGGGGGSLNSSTSLKGTNGADGIVIIRYQMNNVSSVNYSVTSDTSQVLYPGETIKSKPTFIVQNAEGMPVQNVPISFSVTNGTVGAATIKSSVQGIVELDDWTVSETPGVSELTATLVGYGHKPIEITATRIGSPNSLTISTQPLGDINGSVLSQTPVVEVRDTANQVVSNINDPISVTVTTGSGTLTNSTVNFQDGVARFDSLILNGKVGEQYRLTFEYNGISVESALFSLQNAGQINAIEFSQAPLAGPSGSALTTLPQISVTDVNGNVVVAASGDVTVSLSDDSLLTGTKTQPLSQGVADFNDLVLQGIVGTTYQMTFSYLPSGVSTALTVSSDVSSSGPGPASQLVLDVQPIAGNSGQGFSAQPQLTLKDNWGNTITSASGNLVATLYAADGSAVLDGASLSGNTSIAWNNGVAEFTDLVLNGKINTDYNLVFSYTTAVASSLLTATRVVRVSGPGDVTQLFIEVQPQATTNNEILSAIPIVKLMDAMSNLTTSTATVTASLSATPAGTLSDASVNAIAGVATFSNMKINGKINEDYVITFSTTNSLSVSANPFQIQQPGTPFKLAIRDPAPVPGTNGGTFTTPAIIEVLDENDNLNTDATNNITVEIASGSSGALTNNTVGATAGVADFSALTLSGSVGQTYVLRFTSPGLDETSSKPLNLTGSSGAYRLYLNILPIGGKSGAALSTQPEIYVQDKNGNLVTNSTVDVTVSVTNRNDETISNGTKPAVSGIASYTNLSLEGVIDVPYELSFNAPGLISATASVTLDEAGVAHYLEVTRQPVSTVNGAALTTQPQVTIKDVKGNVVKDSKALITAEASGGVTVSSPDANPPVDGVATFSNLAVSGKVNTDYTLTFISPALANATSEVFQITSAGSAYQLYIAQQPVGVQSGEVLSQVPIVEIQDTSGNVVTTYNQAVNISSPSAGSLSYYQKDAVDGVATFTGLVFSGPVDTPIEFIFNTGSLADLSSDPVTLRLAGAANQLKFAPEPVGGTSGQTFATPAFVQVIDNMGNIVKTASEIMTVSKSVGPPATFEGEQVRVVDGIADFSGLIMNGMINVPYTLTFSYPAPGVLPLSTSSFSLTKAGALAGLGVAVPPIADQSGTPFATPAQISLLDANGNLVQSSGVTVTAALPANSTGELEFFTADTVLGIATFTAMEITGVVNESYTLTFSVDDNNKKYEVLHDVILSLAGSDHELVLAQPLKPPKNGALFDPPPQIIIRDVKGNVVTNSSAVVTAEVDNGGTLQGQNGPQPVDGTVTFSALKLNGSVDTPYTITFKSPGLQDAASTPFNLSGPSIPVQLFVDQQQLGTKSDALLDQQPIVVIQDENGNQVFGDKSAVTVTAPMGTGLSGTTTVNAINGKVVFLDLKFKGVVETDYVLNFKATFSSEIPSSPFRLTVAGNPDELRMEQQPVGDVNRATLKTTPIVKIFDDMGNFVSSATNTVTASIASGPDGKLSYTRVDAVAGIADFNQLSLAGLIKQDYTLLFQSPDLQKTTSTPFQLTTASSAEQLFVHQSPVLDKSGVPFTTPVVIYVQDANGNLVEDSQAEITAAVTGNNGSLGDNVVKAVQGKATFTDLALTGVVEVPYKLTFTSDTLIPAVIENIKLTTAGKADHLYIVEQPQAGANGATLSTPAVVQIRDIKGNQILSSSDIITASVNNGGLVKDASFPATQGEVTFNRLTLNGKVGTSYTLTFSSAGLPSINAVPIFVASAGAPAALVILEQPETNVSGEAFTRNPVILIKDEDDNLAQSPDVEVTAALIDVGLGAELSGIKLEKSANGQVTFNGLALSGPINNQYEMQFSVLNNAAISPAKSVPMTLTEEGIAVNMISSRGENQSGFIGTALPLPLGVKFIDAHGNGVEGMTAKFAVKTGGGYLTFTEGVSDAEGVASSGQWVLGQTLGANAVEATSDTLPLVSVTFNATAQAGSGTLPYFGSVNESIGTRFEPVSVSSTGHPLDLGAITSTLSLRDKNDAPLVSNTMVKTVEVSIASGPGSLSSVISGNASTNASTPAPSNSGRNILLINPIDNPFYQFSVISIEPGVTVVAGRVTLQDGTQNVLSKPLNIKFAASQGASGSLRLITQPQIDADGDLIVQPVIGLYDPRGVLQETFNMGDVSAQLVLGTGSLLSPSGNNTAPVINGVAEFTQLALQSTIDEPYQIGFFSPSYHPVVSQVLRRKSAAELIKEDVENLLLRDLKGKIDSKQEKFKSLSKAAIDRLRTYQAYDDYAIDCVPRYVKYENQEEAEKVKDIIARAEMMKAIQPHKQIAKNLFEDPISMFKFTSFKEWIKTIHQIQRDRADVPTINLTPIPVESWLAFKDQSKSADLIPVNYAERKKAVQKFIQFLLSLKDKEMNPRHITFAKHSAHYWLKTTFVPKDPEQRKTLNATVFSNVNQWLKFLHEEKQEKEIGELDSAVLDIAQNSALSLNDWFMFQTLYEQVKSQIGDDASDERILDAMLVKMQDYVDEFDGIQDRAKARKLQIKRSKVRVPITEDKIFTEKTDTRGYWTLPGSCYFSSSQITMLENKNADMNDWRFMPSDIGDGSRLDIEYRHRYGDGKTTWRQSIDLNLRADVTEDLTIKQYEISQYVGWERRFDNTNILGFLLGWDVTQSDIQKTEVEGDIQSASISFGAYGAHIIDQFGLDYYVTLSVGSNSYRLNFVDGYAGTGSVLAKGAYQYVSLLAGFNASLERSQMLDFMYVQPNLGIQSAYAWTSSTSIEAIQRDLNSRFKFDLKDYSAKEMYVDLATDYVFYTNKNDYNYLLHRLNITPKAWYGENTLDMPRFGYGYTIDYSVLMDIHEVKLQYSLRDNEVTKSTSYSFGYSADVGIGQVGISTELNELNQSYSELDFESSF